MDFFVSPEQAFGFSLKVIVPSPPGGIVRSYWATELPQPGTTFLIFNMELPALRTLNLWTKSLSSDICPKS